MMGTADGKKMKIMCEQLLTSSQQEQEAADGTGVAAGEVLLLPGTSASACCSVVLPGCFVAAVALLSLRQAAVLSYSVC